MAGVLRGRMFLDELELIERRERHVRDAESRCEMIPDEAEEQDDDSYTPECVIGHRSMRRARGGKWQA